MGVTLYPSNKTNKNKQTKKDYTPVYMTGQFKKSKKSAFVCICGIFVLCILNKNLNKT